MRGDRVAIVTATNEFITRPIAERVRRRATDRHRAGARRGGRVTGRIRGVPALREGKVTRVAQWLQPQGCDLADFEPSIFYSDRTNDLPLLERGERPVATNPSPALEAIARERGWRILRPVRMIKRFIDKLLGKPAQRECQAGQPASASRCRASMASTKRGRRARGARWCSTLQGGRPRGLHRRRCGARPAGGPAAEGLRRRHQRHARAGEGAVSPRLHHRPALPHRARGVRPRPRARGDRGVDLPRLPRRQRGRAGAGQREAPRKRELAGKTHVVDASGRVLRDNVWGPQIEDAARRDFTVNAMYYDPETRRSWSTSTTASPTRKKRVLRMIGDPATRYREDPVRLIRVVRFAAKLGFEIEKKTAAADGRGRAAAGQRAGVAPVRRDDQAAADRPLRWPASRQLRKHGSAPRRVSGARRGVRRAASSRSATLHRACAGRHRPPRGRGPCRWRRASCWPACCGTTCRGAGSELRQRGEHPLPALQQAIDAVFDARIGDVSGRGKAIRATDREGDPAKKKTYCSGTSGSASRTCRPRWR